jgi:hypothetical protein
VLRLGGHVVLASEQRLLLHEAVAVVPLHRADARACRRPWPP